jgi:hypothetical protein
MPRKLPEGAGGLWPQPHADTLIGKAWQQARDRVREIERLRTDAVRDVAQRRKLAGDPWKYFSVVFGAHLTKQQNDVLQVFEDKTRILVPAANNVGKTYVAAGYALYLFDAIAATPEEGNALIEQGARILLPGPNAATVFETIYSEIMELVQRAEARGYRMPGAPSQKSVNWNVRPKWNMEALTPPERVGQKVAHTASGRHHINQHAIIEEGQGVEESLWLATEGMCSTAGNKIISPFNPTEPRGAAFKRAQEGEYTVVHLDAFSHPNVFRRRIVIAAAIDFERVDAGVRVQCRDRGAHPGTPMDPAHFDFVYALKGEDDPETGPRTDGILGAAGYEPRVYRPRPAFIAQKLGRWPKELESGLFDAEAYARSVARWRASPDPRTAPDNVGIDPARGGEDEAIDCPRWGRSAPELLEAHALTQIRQGNALRGIVAREDDDEEHTTGNGNGALARARCGEFHVYPKGKGPALAMWISQRWPGSPFVMDEGAVGTSPLDHLTEVLKRDAYPVSFGSSALPKLHAEPYCTNMRTQLYVRAAMCIERDLVDVPDDPALREELFAHELKYTTLTVEVYDRKLERPVKTRVDAVALIEKEEVKARIGRSPDRADAWVLSLFQPPSKPDYSQDYNQNWPTLAIGARPKQRAAGGRFR